jgi:hypothetical protein
MVHLVRDSFTDTTALDRGAICTRCFPEAAALCPHLRRILREPDNKILVHVDDLIVLSPSENPHDEGPEYAWPKYRRDYWEPLSEFDNGGEPHPADLLPMAREGGEGSEVPRRCAECGRAAYYDQDDDSYHHAVDTDVPCFLIEAEPDRAPDNAHPLYPYGVPAVAPDGRYYLACNHPNETRPGQCRHGVALVNQTCRHHPLKGDRPAIAAPTIIDLADGGVFTAPASWKRTDHLIGVDAYGAPVGLSDGVFFTLTPCCGSSFKGLDTYVGCRSCCRRVDGSGVPFAPVVPRSGYDGPLPAVPYEPVGADELALANALNTLQIVATLTAVDPDDGSDGRTGRLTFAFDDGRITTITIAQQEGP